MKSLFFKRTLMLFLLTFLLTFVVMPSISFGLGHAFGMDDDQMNILILASIVPGSPLSACFSAVIGAVPALNVVLTVGTTLCSFFMIPLLRWLVPFLAQTAASPMAWSTFPYMVLVGASVIILMPTLLGYGVKRSCGESSRLQNTARGMTWACTGLLSLAVLAWVVLHPAAAAALGALGWQGPLCALLVQLLGGLLGHLCSLLCFDRRRVDAHASLGLQMCNSNYFLVLFLLHADPGYLLALGLAQLVVSWPYLAVMGWVIRRGQQHDDMNPPVVTEALREPSFLAQKERERNGGGSLHQADTTDRLLTDRLPTDLTDLNGIDLGISPEPDSGVEMANLGHPSNLNAANAEDDEDLGDLAQLVPDLGQQNRYYYDADMSQSAQSQNHIRYYNQPDDLDMDDADANVNVSFKISRANSIPTSNVADGDVLADGENITYTY